MKKKLSKVLVLMIVVAFALTGCFGGSDGSDIINGDNGSDEVEVELENSFVEASSYFNFNYPESWENDFKISESDNYTYIDVVISSLGTDIAELDTLINDEFAELSIDYGLGLEASFLNEEEFYEEYQWNDSELEGWNPFGVMISLDTELITNKKFQLGGQPAYRVAAEFTNISINFDYLTEEDIKELEEEFGVNYEEVLEESINDIYYDFIVVLHNGGDHFVEYMASTEAHSDNILEAILDSFEFVD